jgi:hypothetical protein
MHLNDVEATALAQLLIIRQLNDADWIVWEDVPELSEASLHLIEDKIKEAAERETRALHLYERRHDVDARYLLGRAS